MACEIQIRSTRGQFVKAALGSVCLCSWEPRRLYCCMLDDRHCSWCHELYQLGPKPFVRVDFKARHWINPDTRSATALSAVCFQKIKFVFCFSLQIFFFLFPFHDASDSCCPFTSLHHPPTSSVLTVTGTILQNKFFVVCSQTKRKTHIKFAMCRITWWKTIPRLEAFPASSRCTRVRRCESRCEAFRFVFGSVFNLEMARFLL